MEDLKNSILRWKDFVEVAIPENEIWKYCNDEGIVLEPGFMKDTDIVGEYTLSFPGDVHGLIVGGTGAGKSVFINQLIANVTRKYSPRDLELWLIDFKGSEFSFYLPTVEHPKVLPHLKACLCTSDVITTSPFEVLRKEAEKRYKYLLKTGFKNLMEHNKAVRKGSLCEDDAMARILLICDEFQVIFEKAEDNIKQQIMSDLTYILKVGRTVGIHIIFASQSNHKAMPDDLLAYFTLRMALRCAKEVSMAIMGTSYASEIKEPFGYLYVQSMKEVLLEDQKKYRTPYLTDEELREHVNDMADRATEGSYKKRDLITYEETKEHKVE